MNWILGGSNPVSLLEGALLMALALLGPSPLAIMIFSRFGPHYPKASFATVFLIFVGFQAFVWSAMYSVAHLR